MPPAHGPLHTPDLATGRSGCTGCIIAPKTRTVAPSQFSVGHAGTLTRHQAADAVGMPPRLPTSAPSWPGPTDVATRLS